MILCKSNAQEKNLEGGGNEAQIASDDGFENILHNKPKLHRVMVFENILQNNVLLSAKILQGNYGVVLLKGNCVPLFFFFFFLRGCVREIQFKMPGRIQRRRWWPGAMNSTLCACARRYNPFARSSRLFTHRVQKPANWAQTEQTWTTLFFLSLGNFLIRMWVCLQINFHLTHITLGQA
jgi:hypothetical protein